MSIRGDNDLMRVIIGHSDLHHPIVIALQAALLMNVESVLQSKENQTLDDSFEGKKKNKKKSEIAHNLRNSDILSRFKSAVQLDEIHCSI